MPGKNVSKIPIECPLCHAAFEFERALRAHLHEGHDETELVDEIITHVEELERGRV
ncbi:hypothetical protein ACFOZ7_17360 [Natribaculum luteum]|uniref:C2H2-type domain-containing protein n=1 Tax=Natribaculum luteum TaxID=1586232 RepID=A0ABD5P418_9EURY|nr:hypothetical protein [Natribaculum luteum]